MNKILMYIYVLAVAGLFFIVFSEIVRFRILISKGAKAISEAQPFSRHNAESVDVNEPTILVAGDSTGYGTGAESPDVSVAGRLGKDFPKSDITNIAVNGQKVKGLLDTLKTLPADKKFDIILLQIGGNDVVRLTNTDELSKDLQLTLTEAKLHSNNVFIMSCGSVGTAPTFSPIFSHLYDWRTKKVREVFINTVGAFNEAQGVTGSHVHYIDLYVEKHQDPFFIDPKTYYGNDDFHPRGAGYGVWYTKLRAEIVKAGLLN